jgi:hypothetical protein
MVQQGQNCQYYEGYQTQWDGTALMSAFAGLIAAAHRARCDGAPRVLVACKLL